MKPSPDALAAASQWLISVGGCIGDTDAIGELAEIIQSAIDNVLLETHDALTVLAVLKITDAEKPYSEISPELRSQIIKAHDKLLNVLAKQKGAAPTSEPKAAAELDEIVERACGRQIAKGDFEGLLWNITEACEQAHTVGWDAAMRSCGNQIQELRAQIESLANGPESLSGNET